MNAVPVLSLSSRPSNPAPPAVEDPLEERLTDSHVNDDVDVRAPDGPRPAPRQEDPRREIDRDDLTEVATRAVFLDRLRRSTAPEWCVEGLFVLLFDLDAFRAINERFGYEWADQILVEVGARLRKRLRPHDTVARFGPDEFAILLCGLRSGDDVARVIERLQRELALPFKLERQEVCLSASVGVAMGMAGARPEHIIRDAERALSRAQLLGGAGGSLPSSELDPREGSLQHLETALRRALEQEEFRARYRPTVLRKEGRVPGFEIVLFSRFPPGGAARAAMSPRAKAGA